MISRIFISTDALRIKSAGQFAPAIIPVLIYEKSVFSKSAWLNIAINIVGTPLKQVIFSSFTQASDDFGEKYGIPPKGYFVDEAQAEEFDKQFPPKEKLKLPTQLF